MHGVTVWKHMNHLQNVTSLFYYTKFSYVVVVSTGGNEEKTRKRASFIEGKQQNKLWFNV